MPDLFDIDDLDPAAWERVIELALDDPPPRWLAGQGVALLFEKPSARTRSSTEMAVVDPGGHPAHIQGTEVAEEIADAVLEGPRSLVWRQAAHRRTAMRGILAWATRGGA